MAMDPIILESMTRLLQEVADLRKRCEKLEKDAKKRSRGLVDYGDSDDGNQLEFTQNIARGIVKSFDELRLKDEQHSKDQQNLVARIEAIEQRLQDDVPDLDRLKLEEDEKAADNAFFGPLKPYVQDELDKVNKRLDAGSTQTQQKLAATDVRITAAEGELATLRFLVNEQTNQPTAPAQPAEFSQPAQWAPEPDYQQIEDNQRRQGRIIDSLMNRQALLGTYRELSSDRLMIPNSDVHTYMSWSGTYIQIDALRQRVCRRLALCESTVEWKEHADKMTAKWEKEKRDEW